MAAVEELTLAAPLVLPEQGAVQVQVSVGQADDQGARPIEIHSCPAGDPEAEWARNATGSLSQNPTPEPEALGTWPPAGAEPIALEDFYSHTAELGIDYGPAFQGLKAAWRSGEEVFAEVELDPEQSPEAERYAIHPALLDAALHPALLGEEAGALSIPFSWRGVGLLGAGAQQLRVALSRAGEELSLRLADQAGQPLLAIGSLSLRPLDPAQLQSAAPASRSLFELGWSELALPAASEEEQEPIRHIPCDPDPELDPAAAAQALCAEVLSELQGAIAAEEPTRIAFITQGALATGPEESPDPAAASLWGLVRCAQAEHPGRFWLIDADGTEASEASIEAALQVGEPQLALRDGAALAPRLAPAAKPAAEPSPLDPEGTVLISGGTGTLGALFARHLVEEHGARHLILTSRRGPEAPGASELEAELSELGAEVAIAACDVSERSQLKALLDSLDSEHPLSMIVHCAGTTDDALIDSLDAERLATTFAPKASSASHLHELSKEIDGCELILFSSIAGSLQGPGQGNYAAANAFLDALAQRRQAEGLPTLSLAWGAWETESELTARLGEADRARIARTGILALSDEEGTELFDRARGLDSPHLLAVRLDPAALRAGARAGTLPSLFSSLVRIPIRRAAAATGSLATRLAGLSAPEREQAVLELVGSHVAAVLGHASAAAIDPTAAFKDLGFDSLAAVELRNQLGQATGLELPATLVFDHPSTEAVAGYLRRQAEGQSAAPVAVRSPLRSEEPIAIVGMSCRYPGGVDSPEELWRLLAKGEDGISGFPEDRGWDLEGLFDPDPERLGTTYVHEGGFLLEAGEFDAEFFGISPREARTMDPQQRLMLEAAWEACEDAGVDPASLAGSDTGVFAGLMHHDYGLGGSGTAELGGHQGAVSAGALASGHLAYSLGLEGPAVSIDTACSSSLVAMHLAAQALRSGECELALAGGSTVLGTPGLFIELSHQRGLSPDGRCKPFSAAADGIGGSEGVGLLLLERLSDAERNGHEPIALIRGSATNQDGASNGITAPNGPSQERVIRQALANAGLSASEVDAVEAHGTGTTLGDPIEAQAILATYGQNRGEAGPLRLGSIKSNIGHTQAAAGVAGVIKMALAMRHGELPRSLHLEEPTPHVDWSAGEVELLAEPQPWERNGHPRRAGVSSFGISGTNAHLILEEAPAQERQQAPEPEPLPTIPLLLSAKGEGALREQADRLGAHLRAHPELDLADVGASLIPRAGLGHRAAVVGTDPEELLGRRSRRWGRGSPIRRQCTAPPPPASSPSSSRGQGVPWVGMGRELLDESPVFAAQVRACDEALSPVHRLLGGGDTGRPVGGLPRLEHRCPPTGAVRDDGWTCRALALAGGRAGCRGRALSG